MSATMVAEQFLADQLRSDPELMALVPGGVHESQAPDNVKPPYIIVDFPSESDDTNYLSSRAGTVVLPTVRVVGRGVSTSQLAPAAKRVDQLLTVTTAFNVAGGRVNGCQRQSEVRDHVQGADGLWRWLGGVYRISVTEV